MPWATRWPKWAVDAYSASTCSRLKSPDRHAKPTTSASVTVRLGETNDWPTSRSSQ
ncbi:hypothetical protein D3C83_117990 [compost metagenome]